MVFSSFTQFSKFLELVSSAEMESELEDFEGPFTVFAPSDAAFGHLPGSLDLEEVLRSREKSVRMVRRHLLDSQVCCSGVPKQVPLYDLSGHRTQVNLNEI